ncbi:membrane protein [Borreliella chilensis]|uniref:Membrane protein n=1 Tax=Borreliella chilensis TaxID=1245910 RepID=A0A0A7UVQ4_9SPIR|nr:membrane protein [Borreliella chilensis]
MIDFATILVNLFLVSIVLFVYRQYDKRSRALDKIKKFIDLAKVNLEDFIEDKTKEINDLAVDMEAYQRSSIEIIKKIDEVQQKIKNKSNDFAEVEKKIAYHDSMLKDLDEMTLKVQENIQRLQVDGKIVDKLSKTLKGFNTQIDSVESNLNSVLEKFDKTNKENLESIKIASWEKFDINIKELILKMDNLNKEIDLYEKDLANIEERKKDILVKGDEKLDLEFNDFLEKVEFNIGKYSKEIESSFVFYENKYKLIEDSIELIMERVKNQINEKEDFILNRLNEELQNKFKDVFTYVDDRSREIQDKLEDKLILIDDEISSMSSSFKDNAYSRINSLEESIRIEMGKYEEQVDNVFDKFRSQVELNLKNIYGEYEDKISQVDKNIRERVELSLLDLNSKMEGVQLDATALMKRLEDDSNGLYLEFKNKFVSDIELFSESFKDDINKLKIQLESQLLNVDSNIQDKLIKLNDNLISNFEEIDSRFNNDYSNLSDNLNVKYKALFESLDSSSSKFEDQMESKYKGITDRLTSEIDEFSLMYGEKFDRLSQEAINNYREFQDLNKKLENEIGSLGNMFEKTQEILKQDFNDSLISIKDEIGKNIAEFKDRYYDEIDIFVRQLEESKLQYSNWQGEMDSNLKNIESKINKTNEEFISLIEIQKDKGRELSESVFNDLSDHIQKKAIDMHGSWKEELIALNKSLLDIKISSEELLSSATSKIENLERDVNDRVEYVLLKTGDIESLMIEKYKELKDMSYSQSDEVLLGIKEFINRQTEIIKDKSVLMLEDLNKKFDDKNNFIISKIEECDYKLKDFKIESEDVLNNFKSDLNEFIESKLQIVSNIKTDNQKQIDDFLDRISKDILNRKDSIDTEIDSKLSDWQGKLNEITVKIENLLSSGKVDLDLIDSEMTSKIKELQLSIEGLESYYLEKIDDFRNQGAIYSNELLQDIMNHFNKDTRELEENLSKKFAAVLNNSEEFVKEVDSLLQDKRTDFASFQANIDITLDSLNVKFNDINKEINEKYNEVISNYRGYSENISSKLENEIMHEIENLNRRLTDRIDSLSKSMDENLQKLKESFDVSKYQVEKFELRVKDLTDDGEAKISEFVKEIEHYYKSRLEEAIDYRRTIDSDIMQAKERFGEITNDLKNNIESKSEFLNDLYKERFKLIESNFEERYSTFLIESEGAISKIRDEIYKTLTNNDENLQIKISEMDHNFEIVEQRSKEILEFEKELRDRIKDCYGVINAQFGEIKVSVEENIKNHFEVCIKKANTLIDDDILKYENEIHKRIDSLKSIENTFDSIEKSLNDKVAGCVDKIANGFNLKYIELEERCNEEQLNLENKIDNKIKVIDNLALSQYDELEKKYADMYDEFSKRLNSYITTLSEEFKHSNKDMIFGLESQLKNLKNLESDLNSVEKDVIRLKEESYHNVSSHLKLLEEDFFKDLEVRGEELKSSLENFIALYNDKIQYLEYDLSKNLESKTELIQSFHLDIEQKIKNDKENFYLDFTKEFSSKKKDMENEIVLMETNITSRVDEFIDFVNNRQNTIDSWFLNIKDNVKTWQEESCSVIEKRINLAELGIKSFENDILNAKIGLESFKDGFETKAEEMFDNLQSEAKKIEQSVHLDFKNIGEALNLKVLDLEKFVDFKVEKIDERVNKKTEDILIKAEVKFLTQQKDLEDKIFELNQKLEHEFTSLSANFEKVRQEMGDLIFNDKESFEGQVELMHKNISEFSEKINLYKNNIETSIENEYNYFSKSIRSECGLLEDELKKSLKHSKLEIETVKNGLQEQIDKFEGEFKKNYKELLREVDANVLELESKISNYDIKFNKFVSDIKDNLVEYKSDLRAEFEDRYDKINFQIENFKKLDAELEKNNSIFLEAYSLKDKLEQLWGTLKNEINLAQEYKNNFENVNKEFHNIQKETSSIIETFNELKLERESIKAIKNDFNRFFEFYSSFDSRYRSLTESYDEMQIYKAKIKEIADEQRTILDNYERISNKESILKSTIESVDKNFDLINEVEKRFNNLNKESAKFQNNLKDMENVVSNLLLNKGLSEEVLVNAQNLKEMLLDIENKLKNTLTMREKVVKSETRLENLNIAAEERIKTLGILVKTDSKYQDNVGLNNKTVRNSVIKLMRQGWSAEEISRATKLSIGEVELILELGISNKDD